MSTTVPNNSMAGLPEGALGSDASSGGVVWGACAETARRFGLSVLVVRAAIVILTIAGGFGFLAYGALTLWSRRSDGATLAPAASRDLGVAVVCVGLVWQLSGWWPGVAPALVVPAALVALGVVVGWRDPAAPSGSVGAAVSSGATPALATMGLRIFGGSVLLLSGFAVVFGQQVSFSELRDTGLALVVAIAGLALVMGPTALRLVRSVGAERDARIRSHERAAVAAHLHDSVLQTLTLIQKRADDPAATVALARHQERSLRRWLYGGGEVAASLDGVGWRGRAERLVTELEDQYLVAIELVMVGDGESTPSIDAALLAAREALVNAAKFSGVDVIDVFCERSEGRFEVFVRDRGKGFDLATIGADRHGIRDSIIGRVERVGGRARIRTAAGEGTEVHVEVPE
ncbi:MAG: histidine kinase [Actinobacteria bacterium]|nr:histidine kinase [Actinomycetota bacterium]